MYSTKLRQWGWKARRQAPSQWRSGVVTALGTCGNAGIPPERFKLGAPARFGIGLGVMAEGMEGIDPREVVRGVRGVGVIGVDMGVM